MVTTIYFFRSLLFAIVLFFLPAVTVHQTPKMWNADPTRNHGETNLTNQRRRHFSFQSLPAG
jgi:hypothetical protein